MTELKPCPWCGGAVEGKTFPNGSFYGIHCDTCKRRTFNQTPERWNNRPTEQAARVAGIREALELAIRDGSVKYPVLTKMQDLADRIERENQK